MTIKIETYHAGHLQKGVGYQYFMPSLINEQWAWDDPQLNTLVEKAAIKLGELNSSSQLVPDINLFIQLHITEEAIVSSRIEGTQTDMDEALLPEKEIHPERRDDWREVNNYIRAMNDSIAMLDTLPLSSRLLKQAHKNLLDSVRGQHKQPGGYRTSQNWIGGASLADAVFVPPIHNEIGGLMGDLESFLHNDDIHLPKLIRIAIAHYQFETIHPFLDGNGRIGRLLIPLFLVSDGVMSRPLLSLSGYFGKDKSLYYDNLTRVRTHHDMLRWIKYFLIGIEQTAGIAVRTLDDIIKLKGDTEQQLQANLGRRYPVAMQLLHHLFQKPVINTSEAKAVCGVSFRSASALIASMVDCRVLSEIKIATQSRHRWFVFQKYLDCFDRLS